MTPKDGRPGGGPLSLIAVVVGAAGFAASLACVYIAMRDVMTSNGGFCASGGPYEISPGQECQSGQIWLLMGGVFVGLAFAALLVGASGRWGGWRLSGVGLLLWAALFGALGWNFIDLGLDPPPNINGATGWLFAGAVFWMMALGGLIPGMLSVISWFRSADQPDSAVSSFKAPLVRADVAFERNMPGDPAFGSSTPGAPAEPPGGAQQVFVDPVSGERREPDSTTISGTARAWSWLVATLIGSAAGVAIGIAVADSVIN
jgi:hypothetical protein